MLYQKCHARNKVAATAIECWCKKVFRTEKLYNRHYMEQHVIMLKQFEWCGDCEAWFKIDHGITHRKQMHSKKYICDVCGKEFKLSQRLDHHKLSHREPTKACQYCGVQYYTNRSLRRHIKIKHTCSQCGKVFKSPSSLQSHFTQEHGPSVELACDICGKCLKSAICRRAHMLSHTEDPPFKIKCGYLFKHGRLTIFSFRCQYI